MTLFIRNDKCITSYMWIYNSYSNSVKYVSLIQFKHFSNNENDKFLYDCMCSVSIFRSTCLLSLKAKLWISY